MEKSEITPIRIPQIMMLDSYWFQINSVTKYLQG